MIKERESLINLLNAFLYLGLYSKHDYALIFSLSALNVSCIKREYFIRYKINNTINNTPCPQ